MLNLFKVIFGRGGARTRARCLVVQRWLAIPEASPIGPEKMKIKNDEIFIHSGTAQARKGGLSASRAKDYHNWKRPDGIYVPSVPAGDDAIHSVPRHSGTVKTTNKRQSNPK